jgi:hypothetical protein
VFPVLPDPQACTITSDPPKLEALPGDIAAPGQMGCPVFFEACLSQKAAAWLVEYQQWVDEQVAKCKAKPMS